MPTKFTRGVGATKVVNIFTPHSGTNTTIGFFKSTMALQEFARAYALRAGASPGYTDQLIVLTKRLPWGVADLTVDNIDAYLTRALGHLAASTVHNHRRMLSTLRKAALRDGLLVDDCTRPIRKVKHHLPMVRAWTHSEMRHLLAVAAEMPGGTLHCPHRVLLPAWILVGYSSGLRLGDMLAITFDSLRGDRLATVLQKTRQQHVVVLDANALEAIGSLPRRGPKIFGSLVGRSRIIVAMRSLVKQAGLTGSGKYLRRASATYAQMAGIDASGHLGHLTPGMKRHYLDPVILADLRRAVPSLDLAGSR
jgi:site-specific recombinase XerD